MLLRARILITDNRPPVEDAGLFLARDRVVRLGSWKHIRRLHTGPIADLGESLVLPGLINAHCHLDYTGMAGLIPPVRSFTDWIKSITSIKGTWSDAEFARDWMLGAQMLLSSGTTTVADVEAVPELLPSQWKATPLRVISFLEMTGVRSRRDPRAIVSDAIHRATELRGCGTGIGLSPHALYSTTPALLRLSHQAASRHEWRLVTHVAESLEEFDMIRHARGPLFDWLRRNDRDMTDCGQHSPVAQLHSLGCLTSRLLAVHVNYLAPGDARLLARRGVHVVHCPRSHDYFRHQRFPYARLARAGVNISLGTDSLITVRKTHRQEITLDLFAEMQAFTRAHPNVAPTEVLAMVTRNPARALGFAGQLGTLRAGAVADLILLPYAGAKSDAVLAAVHHRGSVSASMIRGNWILPPAHLPSP
jgi:cytosine/adenosine deaminase-related metal-dependent hydrolase